MCSGVKETEDDSMRNRDEAYYLLIMGLFKRSL